MFLQVLARDVRVHKLSCIKLLDILSSAFFLSSFREVLLKVAETHAVILYCEVF